MSIATDGIAELTTQEYEAIRQMVYDQSGINLGQQKMQLVRSRLGKILRKGNFSSFREYIQHVKTDTSGQAMCTLLDAISTNTTHLFREPHHFELMDKIIREWVGNSNWRAANPELRIWCAASSSGEEPHTLAMTAHNALRSSPGTSVKILATDISTKVLALARAGKFDATRTSSVPPDFLKRYLQPVPGDDNLIQAVPEIRAMITFARFNLMTPSFPFKQGFHIVFCRNVMIYFDRETQQTLVNKIAGKIHPGGYFFIGHSESLNNISHPMNYVEPTVYRI